MIFDSIRNKENYREYETLYTVLCYLEGLHRGELPQPNTVIAEHKIFCNPVSFTSKPEEACIYEAHKKYIDLHYIVSGKRGSPQRMSDHWMRRCPMMRIRISGFIKAVRPDTVC